MSTEKKDFTGAKAACAAMSAKLAEPQDSVQQKAAYSLLVPFQTSFVGVADSATEAE